MNLTPEDILILQSIVGDERVRTDADSLAVYGRDWTRVFSPAPAAVVFPGSAEQVQALVLRAQERRWALVPSGGRTGLSGAAVAERGEIVVSFDRMNRILDFIAEDRMVKVEAGVVTQQLQAYASERGLYYPVDFASAGSSQMGGNIGTNAGGIKVIRYGMTRDWVMGLKVVTGRGDILELNGGMIKNATGYDLRHLFIGAEGTLGFVVEATIALERAPRDLRVMVLGVPDFAAVMPLLQAFREQIELSAFEFFSELALQLGSSVPACRDPSPAVRRFMSSSSSKASMPARSRQPSICSAPRSSMAGSSMGCSARARPRLSSFGVCVKTFRKRWRRTPPTRMTSR